MWEIIRKNKINLVIKSTIAILISVIFYSFFYGISVMILNIIFSAILGVLFYFYNGIFFEYCEYQEVEKACYISNFMMSVGTQIFYIVQAIFVKIFSLFMEIDNLNEFVNNPYLNQGYIYISYFLVISFAIPFFVFIFKFLSIYKKPYQINKIELIKIDRNRDKIISNIVEESVIAAGLNNIPLVYILDSDIVNAYSCGINTKNSSIVISKGLLKLLNRDELQGIISHEIAHILNGDTSYLLCLGSLSAGSKYFTEEFKLKNPRVLLDFEISKIGQLICNIMLMFISKNREYLADACACVYTRNPSALVSALEKIKKYKCENNIEQSANDLIKASFIVPFDEKNSTHPSTEKRIKILRSMTSADYWEYENQYQKLNHKKLIPQSELKNAKKMEIQQMQEKTIQNEIISACVLNVPIKNKEQIKTIKENKEIIKQNIQKHIEVEDFVHALAGYTTINCECATKLKIPPVYKNKIIICPHCNKKHICS